jgi:DNA-damage-inducible protein J
MTENAVVRARIAEAIKDEATDVLADMGLTVSDAIRILLTRVAREKRLPFELTPNALTAATLSRSERGEDLHKAANADALFKELGL